MSLNFYKNFHFATQFSSRYFIWSWKQRKESICPFSLHGTHSALPSSSSVSLFIRISCSPCQCDLFRDIELRSTLDQSVFPGRFCRNFWKDLFLLEINYGCGVFSSHGKTLPENWREQQNPNYFDWTLGSGLAWLLYFSGLFNDIN